jgi:hypothetical protein
MGWGEPDEIDIDCNRVAIPYLHEHGYPDAQNDYSRRPVSTTGERTRDIYAVATDPKSGAKVYLTVSVRWLGEQSAEVIGVKQR